MNTKAVRDETDAQKSSATENPGKRGFKTVVWASAIGTMVEWYPLGHAAPAAVDLTGRVK